MKAATKIQAERIATAGAKKMTAQGYTMKPVAGTEFLPVASRSVFNVINPDKDRYTVNIKKGTCNCGFFNENQEFGICKHIEWGREEVAAEAAILAKYEEAPIDRIPGY